MSKAQFGVRLMSRIALTVVCAAVVAWSSIAVRADEPAAPAVDPGHAQRKPKRFAIIFNMGYSGDALPKEKEDFEKLAKACKEANYNTLLCKYEDWRAEICKKYDLQIMVDLLVAENHVFRNPEGAKKLCESLKGNDAVYGYHLWSDRVGKTVPGRNRDIANVHQWDPTHPNYVGTYVLGGNSGFVNPDLHGYYDFHFKRGGLWPHLLAASNISRTKDAYFLIYMASDPGRVGVGNVNRLMFTNSVSIACGLKGMLYHYRGGTYAGDGKWDTLGQDLAKANTDIAPMCVELMKIGNPTAIYSTPITIDINNRTPINPPAVPAPLVALPADFWTKIEGGECVIGAYKDDQAHDVVVLANHNAYKGQSMKVRLQGGAKSAELFDRKTAKWQPIAAADGVVAFEMGPGSFEMLRAGK
ncbi:MAG: hypothetical protein K8T25_13270 [Planctomycetia bacterium]|nr:hypothetical protein [Planctomycetia bacterium]